MSSTESECATRVYRRSELVATQSQGSAPQRALLLNRVPDSQALRVRATSLLRVCSLGFRVFWERTWSGCCCSEREGVGPSFCGTLDQASRRCSPWVLDAGCWSPGREARPGRIPNRCNPRPPVAGKGSFPCWRGLPTPPPPPGPHASLEVSEGGGRRQLGLGLGVGKDSGWCGSPRVSGFDGIIAERRPMEKFYNSNSLCGVLESGGESLAPWSFSLSLSSRQALLGLGFPCMARSGVVCYSWLFIPFCPSHWSGWGRGGLGITHFAGLLPSANYVPGVLQSSVSQTNLVSGERAKPSYATIAQKTQPHSALLFRLLENRDPRFLL